jgi:hypothetical protein
LYAMKEGKSKGGFIDDDVPEESDDLDSWDNY